MSDISNPMDVDRTRKAADCADCDGTPPSTRIVNHSMMWHDGDVVCAKPDCCRFVRNYDAG